MILATINILVKNNDDGLYRLIYLVRLAVVFQL